MDDTTIAWIIVVVAGLMEPTWVYFLEKCDNFRIVKWDICMAVTLFLSIFLMSLAMRELGPGTTYAVWTGIGVIGSMVVGAIFFKEKVTWVRMLFLMLILIGIVGINVAGASS